MDYRYLLAADVLCTILLLTLTVHLFFRNRKWKKSIANRDREIAVQAGRISELDRKNRNLSALYEQSNDTCIKRTEFYSNITHELKTPLSVILGAIQLIERKRAVPEGEDAVTTRNLGVIRYNCYRMLRLTNNLLDLTRLEAGYLQLKPVFCNLESLLEDIVHSVVPYAAQKQLTLLFVRPDRPVDTAVDLEKMERILLNLLSNSIKFTNPGGTITVSAFEKDGRACISVKDTGVGISPAMQQEIFGRYKQAGEHPVLENEGCGIGLSLVKSFVELHNGRIELVSDKGRGSEFIIDLPLITQFGNGTGEDSIDDAAMTNTFSDGTAAISSDTADSHPDEVSLHLKETVSIEFSDLHPIAS